VLLDLERFSLGPREWDLAVVATQYCLGWLDKSDYDEFAGSYGFDVVAWAGFPVLLGTRQLTMTTWLMQNVASSSEAAEEFRLRMASLRGEAPDRAWHAL
jgi:hypothetical protein